MSKESTVNRKRTENGSRALAWGVSLLLLGAALTLTILYMQKVRNREVQLQSDARVATVWLAGTTWGPNHTLQRGTPWQKWLNDHNITAFGKYSRLHSQYEGEPGVQLWLDYQSHLITQDLECHRVGETAFTDDLGQSYHGYLDLQSGTVGVYLPGYDHAAHRLFCTIHWMPRKPAAPFPVSFPMRFTVEMPPPPRLLPLTSTLSHDPQTVTHNGIAVTVSEVHLGPREAVQSPYLGSRTLTFRMKVTGGEFANSNVDAGKTLSYYFANGAGLANSNGRATVLRVNPTTGAPSWSISDPLSITDPYGIELIPAGQLVYAPSDAAYQGPSDGKESVWRVRVNNAGKGTDAVRFQCNVRPAPLADPNASDSLPEPVSFDIIVPVQNGNEI